MMGFKRKAPECVGDYRFDGPCYQTRGVYSQLQPVEVWHIVADIRQAVEREEGIDYLQVFEAADGRIVWAIDDKCHWTLLLPEEY